MKAVKSAVTVSTVLACVAAVGTRQTSSQTTAPQQSLTTTTDRASTPKESSIKVEIATVGSDFGPPTTRYKVGEQIPIAITMTNKSDADVFACVSSDLYQNLPKLTRDGQPVAYMNSQSFERVNAQTNHVCEKENLPQAIMLKANESKLVDWFVLSGNPENGEGEPWYDPLPPGKYELTIQRRLACCDGPMIVSNTTSFEVVR
jgi:hypothetical protein